MRKVEWRRASCRRIRSGAGLHQHSAKRESHERILKVLRVAGANGQTAKEIAAYFQKPLHKISGRLSELKEMGEIEPTGARRNGSAVLRVREGA